MNHWNLDELRKEVLEYLYSSKQERDKSPPARRIWPYSLESTINAQKTGGENV